jgi:hypothetical protein
MREWLPVMHPDLRSGIDFYFSAAAFYEFAIVLAGALGVIAFLALQLRSRMAALAFLWTIFSIAFFIADPVHHPDWLVMMIVPAALMGAVVIDRLHHTDAWRFLRYPIAALALLTLYVQLAINFVHVSPDPTEASWSRHMLLFWTDPTTSDLAKEEFSHAQRAVSDRGTVFFAQPGPVPQWYFRDLKPADSAANADLIVAPAAAEKPSNLVESSDFTLDETWSPSLAGLNLRSALRYFFTQKVWSAVSGTEVRVDVRGALPPVPAPAAGSSPEASASPEASPPASSASPMPAAMPSSTETPTPTPEATATPNAEPTAVETTGPTAEPTGAPTQAPPPATALSTEVPTAMSSPVPSPAP